MAVRIITRRILVKISGDLIQDPRVYEWLVPILKRRRNEVVIIVGGGPQVSEQLRKEGVRFRFGPSGREIMGERGQDIVLHVLAVNLQKVRALLADYGIYDALIDLPLLMPGSVLCYANGDEYVKACYHGFHELWILTKKEKRKEKLDTFREFPKVRVLAFP